MKEVSGAFLVTLSHLSNKFGFSLEGTVLRTFLVRKLSLKIILVGWITGHNDTKLRGMFDRLLTIGGSGQGLTCEGNRI